jgi:uncharacterized protein (DUF983 family)
MSDQRETDGNLKTRQLIVGVIILAAMLALISPAGLSLRPWVAMTVGYAVTFFVLLLFGRLVRAVERLADGVGRITQREEKDL